MFSDDSDDDDGLFGGKPIAKPKAVALGGLFGVDSDDEDDFGGLFGGSEPATATATATAPAPAPAPVPRAAMKPAAPAVEKLARVTPPDDSLFGGTEDVLFGETEAPASSTKNTEAPDSLFPAGSLSPAAGDSLFSATDDIDVPDWLANAPVSSQGYRPTSIGLALTIRLSARCLARFGRCRGRCCRQLCRMTRPIWRSS